MARRRPLGWTWAGAAALWIGAGAWAAPVAASGEQTAAAPEVTFTKDVAPILQRNCQPCHRPNGVAPMPLVTYQDVQPWAPRIKTGLGLGPQRRARCRPIT